LVDERALGDIRADIPFLKKGVYVDNASISPLPKSIQTASDRYNDLVVEQTRDTNALARARFDEGRALAAKLVGGSPLGIAYVQNTSHGLSLVALGLDWRPGDNLIVCEQEFPSNYLCWLQLASQGVDVRTISSPDGTLTPDHLRKAIDDRPRVVAVSHVQFYSGFRVDLPACGDICSRRGALLVVDDTQSVGAMKIDVGAAGVDVLVASAHKWLMGPRGIGFVSFSERAFAQVTPRIVGWFSVNDPFEFNRALDFLPDARRFESGTPNGTGIFGLAERLHQLNRLGSDWIEKRILDLNELLCERALSNGLQPVHQFERHSRSGIALLRKPNMEAVDVNSLLTQNAIFASVRNGATRISAHYYNTPDEIERIISVLGHERSGAA
jgi:cysteine desulfurase / selenocysteine lyase